MPSGKSENKAHLPSASTLSKDDILQILDKYGSSVPKDEFLKDLEDHLSIQIPLSIFIPQLTAYEAVCRYLHDTGYSFREIGKLLHKNERSVWITHRKARSKFSDSLDTSGEPISITALYHENLSLYESLVLSLSFHYRNKEIAQILHRDQRSIATILNRAKRKWENKN